VFSGFALLLDTGRMTKKAYPVKHLKAPPPGSGFRAHAAAAAVYPVLSAPDEEDLVSRWKTSGDEAALCTLVGSHMRLIVSLASRWQSSGLDAGDLIGEGTSGFMRAVHGFDPHRGARLATYGAWWIRKHLRTFVLEQGHPLGLALPEKPGRLYLGLRAAARRAGAEPGNLSPENVRLIAEDLQATPEEVIRADCLLALGVIALDAQPENNGAYPDMLAGGGLTPEEILSDSQGQDADALLMKRLLDEVAMLGEREKSILTGRRLTIPQMTLESLARRWNISGERVRQIEIRALDVLRDRLTSGSDELLAA
jgi:RNA polymerase sigma-32 factor